MWVLCSNGLNTVNLDRCKEIVLQKNENNSCFEKIKDETETYLYICCYICDYSEIYDDFAVTFGRYKTFEEAKQIYYDLLDKLKNNESFYDMPEDTYKIKE